LAPFFFDAFAVDTVPLADMTFLTELIYLGAGGPEFDSHQGY